MASGTGAINRNGAGLSQYAGGGFVGVLDGKSFAMYESSGDIYDPEGKCQQVCTVFGKQPVSAD
ncbi:MAG: hypothetical protein U0T77_04965 [Chitinophagales bacterium]